MGTTNEILSDALLGEQLSAVTFVMDYFQLEFDGTRLIIFAPPIATVHDEPAPGYRDRLCSFIAQRVTSAYEVENFSLHIEFGSFGRIVVLLDEDSRVTVEAAELIHAGKSVLMW